MHVVVKGRGTPVLVLHGLLSDHTQVYPLLPALSGHKAYFPDLLGCGKTKEGFTIDIVRENAGLLRKLCEKHKIQAVIAYSMAGMLALELRLPKTIFVSSYCSNPAQHGPLSVIKGREPAAEVLLVRHREQLQKLFQSVDYKVMPGLKRASVDAGLYYMVASLADRRDQAASLARVLVVHGTRDKLVHPELGEELAKITNADSLFVPADHSTVLTNRTARAAIARFLES